jgi:thiol:disulfide interchange protein DsbC
MKRPSSAVLPFSLGLALLLGACAGEGPGSGGNNAELEAVRDRVAEFLPEIKREDVRPSAAAGLYEVQQGSLFGYVTADGKYLISGDMIDMKTGEGITENRRRSDRALELVKLADDTRTITFAPEGGADEKHTITVFTDIDCGYCRRLHREVPQLNAAGVAVRYVFYPRSGPQTESFQKAVAVWCSADRKDALTRAKAGEPQNLNVQCDNPVMDDYLLGQRMGLRGTPMIILPDGEVVNGYVPAPALAARVTGEQPKS